MRRAVVICPGRGTYNKPDLGSLMRLNPDKTELFQRFDAIRRAGGQDTVTELDGAATYSVARHTRGDTAAALIYAASYADFLSLKDIDVLAVTGNSMGWYTTLACAGALSADQGFELVNTMGQMMQESLIGGQIVYPITDDTWQPDTGRRAEVMQLVTRIASRADHSLALSIDLGGLLVLAGNDAGLAAFTEQAEPQGQFPLRLPNHAAFHTALQAPVALAAQNRFDPTFFAQPKRPMIDGRGAIWWPHATDTEALHRYTLGHQVTAPYDFAKAISCAAREFAPDVFIVLGPGTTLGGAVAQSLIKAGWLGMRSKQDFQTRQSETTLLTAMGRPDQRPLVTGNSPPADAIRPL